jgi:hypothetical protein
MERFYPMIIAVILLTCFLLYVEVRRVNKARLPLRLLATVLMAFSFLFLIVPLPVKSPRTIIPGKLLLLTKGYPGNIPKNVKYFTLDSTVLRVLGSGKVNYIPELGYHLRTHPEISGLKVFGYGLSAAELKEVGDRSYQFQAATAGGGVRSISWPVKLPSSALLNVEGIYENTSSSTLKLVLEGLGTRMDSVLISPGQKRSFKLSCRPKQVGPAIYHLVVQEGSGEVSREPIPFTVFEPAKVKVMVLAAAPDFEDKFLRNWLLENKYPAYFRTRISKDKFSIDAVNIPGVQAPAFSASMFDNYDVIIADDEELAALPQIMQSRLRSAVTSGAGLLVRLTEERTLSTFARRFRVQSSNDSLSSSVIPVLSEENTRLKPVTASRPAFIMPNPEQLPLVENPAGKILLSNTMQGKGRIAASTIHTTYNWLLTGSTSDYSRYWSAVLNKTARQAKKELSWSISPQFPTPAEELALSFQIQSYANLPGVLLNKTDIAVQQHPILPFFWQSSVWAEQRGWNEFKIGDKPAEPFYVYDPEDWTGVKCQERIAANEEFALKSKKDVAKEAEQVEITTDSISRWWFFGIFLIAVAFLWYETKILQ